MAEEQRRSLRGRAGEVPPCWGVVDATPGAWNHRIMDATLKLREVLGAAMMMTIVGCNKQPDQLSPKAATCNRMGDVLNAAAATMDAYRPMLGGPVAETDLAKAAQTSREVAELASNTQVELRKLEGLDERLDEYRTTYVAILGAMTKQMRAMAEAMDESAKMGRNAGDEANQALASSRREIEVLCRRATESCKQISRVMSRVPVEPTEEELPKVLKRYADDLSALKLEEPLRHAVDNHVKTVRAFERLVI